MARVQPVGAPLAVPTILAILRGEAAKTRHRQLSYGLSKGRRRRGKIGDCHQFASAMALEKKYLAGSELAGCTRFFRQRTIGWRTTPRPWGSGNKENTKQSQFLATRFNAMTYKTNPRLTGDR